MLRETITLAWREIRAHLMRSCLTTLGIVIGVSAVIAILTVSDGLKARVTKELSGIGGNLRLCGPARQAATASPHLPNRSGRKMSPRCVARCKASPTSRLWQHARSQRLLGMPASRP